MQMIWLLILAFAMGVLLSVYLPMNSLIAEYVGSPINTNIIFFLVALVTSIFIFLVFGDHKTIFKIGNVPPYLFITGVTAAFMILGTTYLIPKIGARKLFILVVAGQIIMAMILSHFGVLGSPKDPLNIKKMGGALLLLIGAIISV